MGLLTVFVVAQPQQSGSVLAKSERTRNADDCDGVAGQDKAVGGKAINRIVLPDTLGSQLWHAVADARQTLADYAVTLLEHGDTAPLRAKLLVQANVIDNLPASASFE